MKTEEDILTCEEAADAQAVIEHAMTGVPLHPEIARRIRTRSERATEELRRQYGTVSLAVDLIRDVRDQE